MIYEYTDTYIISSLEEPEIQAAEDKALTDLGKQGVTDPFYLEELCKCLVYIDLATSQLEAENMDKRIAQYREEYKRYSKMQTHDNSDKGVSTVTIGRA